jgi:DNA-binding HxlR family transcriptional regulator
MTTKRSYGDGCAIAQALDVVGERWALLVVRELLLGAKRFTDLKKGLPNASPNVLSERLRELERAGVIKRDKLPPPAASRVYELTEWGQELEETVFALGHWGTRSPSPPPTDPVGADSIMLALKARFDPAAADGLRASYELRFGEDRFRLAISERAIHVARGGAEQPDATIETDPRTLFAVLWDGRSLTGAQRSGVLRIEGDAGAVKRLVGLFTLRAPAST